MIRVDEIRKWLHLSYNNKALKLTDAQYRIYRQVCKQIKRGKPVRLILGRKIGKKSLIEAIFENKSVKRLKLKTINVGYESLKEDF